jgi:hypothetical protein
MPCLLAAYTCTPKRVCMPSPTDFSHCLRCAQGSCCRCCLGLKRIARLEGSNFLCCPASRGRAIAPSGLWSLQQARMQATMQRTAAPSVAGRSSALVAPAIRPSAAARHAAFKPAGPVAQRSAAVVARAAAVSRFLLWLGTQWGQIPPQHGLISLVGCSPPSCLQVEQEEPLVVGVDEATQQSYLKLPQGYHW